MEFISVKVEFEALDKKFHASTVHALINLQRTKENCGKWGIDSLIGSYTNFLNKFSSTMDKEVYKLNVFSKMIYKKVETKDDTIKALNVLKKECFNTINTLIENYISVLPRMSEPLLEPHYHELTQLLKAFSFHFLDNDINLACTGDDIAGIDKKIDIIMGSILDHAKNLTILPRTNKVACRRRMMQGIKELNDTVKEFTGYVEEADSVNSGIPLEYDSDRDEDDLPYTVDEAATAKSCIFLWQLSDRVMKEVLRVMSDYAASNDNHSSNHKNVQQVIVKVVDCFGKMRVNVTDLAAELFSPFEDETVSKYYNNLKRGLNDTITALIETNDNISSIDSEEEYHPITIKDREKLLQLLTQVDLVPDMTNEV